MKILWIVNIAPGPLNEKLYHTKGRDLWIGALLEGFKGKQEWKIAVATTANIKKRISIQEDNITYYALPGQVPLLYKENNADNIAAWRTLLEEEKPDLIQVWGTEFTHGLCALRQAGGIPSVIFIQGYLGSIARYYLAGIPYREARKTLTFRDFLKHDGIIQQQKKYERSTIKEREMLQLSGRIISESRWCEENIRAIAPSIQVYHCPISINSIFREHEWNIENIERHSIMCTASGYPIKGLHMMLRAVALLKQEFPDIKLYVPGTPQVSDGSLQQKLRKRGYTKYIERLIKELNLSSNIIWMGMVSQEKLAEQYQKSHVFVMCSAIENHSSSLMEAMMVGVPCISSAVGEIPEYVKNGENGLLYRFEEYAMLAGHIRDIFGDNNLALRLSRNGKSSIFKMHNNDTIMEDIISTYIDIQKKTRKGSR